MFQLNFARHGDSRLSGTCSSPKAHVAPVKASAKHAMGLVGYLRKLGGFPSLANQDRIRSDGAKSEWACLEPAIGRFFPLSLQRLITPIYQSSAPRLLFAR